MSLFLVFGFAPHFVVVVAAAGRKSLFWKEQTHIYIYMYVCIERERRKKERKKEKEDDREREGGN